jgi:hypothetical protein
MSAELSTVWGIFLTELCALAQSVETFCHSADNATGKLEESMAQA